MEIKQTNQQKRTHGSLKSLIYRVLPSKRQIWLGTPPETINLPKGNLTVNEIHFRYWKNIYLFRNVMSDFRHSGQTRVILKC